MTEIEEDQKTDYGDLYRAVNSLKEDLSKKQEYFKINIQNMDSPTYEDNTINDLLVMKKLKTEIEQLELMLQMNEIFHRENT